MSSEGVRCHNLMKARNWVGTRLDTAQGSCAHFEPSVAPCCLRVTGLGPLTLNGKGLAHSQQFAVGVDGDLIVQE